MTLLEQLEKLLALHGINARGIDRIDIAIEKLYKAEMAEKAQKTETPRKVEEKRTKREPKVTEEHMGI